MASDELLLELAEEGICSLRFYTWAEPTVSLGYFQNSSLLSNSQELKMLPWVRRATGGEALVHHHELTYALGLPLDIAGQKSTLWQEKMHLIIQKALLLLGVSLPEINLPELRNDPSNLLCFHHHVFHHLQYQFFFYLILIKVLLVQDHVDFLKFLYFYFL